MANEIAQTPNIIADQIGGRLHQIFDDLIVVEKTGGMDEDAAESRFLTRAYAALSLIKLSNANVSEAADAVTDGGKDDGIDAIYVSESQKKVFLIQSKWFKNTQKGVSLADVVRFRDGIKRVINLRWDELNSNLHKHRDNVEHMLKDIDTEIIAVISHNSAQDLSEDINRAVDEFLHETNKYGELVSFCQFTLREARETARSKTRPENINLSLMLKNWGMIEHPFKSVYGAILGLDLVTWYENNRERLFAENLRFGIEKSDVNDGIRQTAREEPENFWYFNNGVTAICDDINKQPVGGNNTESGVFDVQKISVINGAQTISSLARAKHEGATLDGTFVHLRVISLSGTPENFATDVTTANNTQNDLSPIDFVAADENQDRIRREATHVGLIYTYRRGDQDPPVQSGFTVREATIAAACASGELRLAVSSKRYISGLWENTKKEPYTKLFNEQTSAEWLWKAVQVERAVDAALEQKAKILEGRERLVAVHANRFILFQIFEEIKAELAGSDVNKALRDKVAELVNEKFSEVYLLIEEKFSDAYPGNIFKNVERQSEILNEMNRQK